MPQVTAAGTRAGWSAVGAPASAGVLAPESLGDSEGESAPPGASLARESPGDSASRDGASDAPVDRESLGDSEATGDSERSLGVPEGVACGDADEPEPPEAPALPALPPEPFPELGDGLLDWEPPPDPPVDPPPLDGVAVGEDDVGDAVGEGEAVGDGLGLGVAVAVRETGGATLGGTPAPDGRSCCHDHPTDPPAGTVSAPTPEEEKVHDAFEPSAHHSPQKALAGEAFTHGSLVGTPLTRHTKPGCRVA